MRSGAIPFWKMSGSGNDFVVIDNRTGLLPPQTVASFTRLVCRHRISVGADGVVLISDAADPDVDFMWRYINADGSDGEMCGNGAMCGARFAVLNGIAPAECRFQTEAGVVRAWVDPDPGCPAVRIAIADPGPLCLGIDVAAAGHDLTLHAITVGVPHAVVVTPDVDAFAPGDELIPIGRSVRHHAAFAPAGTNFNVISVLDRHTVRMRTYERGVEAETLACGTGAIASAIIASALEQTEPPVTVVTTSGRPLRVDFTRQARRVANVTLGGDARVIARGEIDSEALL